MESFRAYFSDASSSDDEKQEEVPSKKVLTSLLTGEEFKSKEEEGDKLFTLKSLLTLNNNNSNIIKKKKKKKIHKKIHTATTTPPKEFKKTVISTSIKKNDSSSPPQSTSINNNNLSLISSTTKGLNLPKPKHALPVLSSYQMASRKRKLPLPTDDDDDDNIYQPNHNSYQQFEQQQQNPLLPQQQQSHPHPNTIHQQQRIINPLSLLSNIDQVVPSSLQKEFGVTALANAKVVDVAAVNPTIPFPEFQHRPYQEKPKEPAVRASFWNSETGAVRSSSKPSGVHRRKHHINFLAYDAQVKAIEAEEKSLRRRNQRKQSRNRYGF